MKRNLIPLALVGLMTILALAAALVAIHNVGRIRFPHAGASRGHALTQPGGTAVQMVHLPSSDLYNRLFAAGGQLELEGQPNSAVNAVQSSPCLVAPLNLKSLAVGPATTENCNDPATIGRSLEAVVTAVGSGNSLAVSIARTDPSTGQSLMSAPFMRCQYASDTQPVIAYGGGSIWVYDVATTFGSMVVQLSATTGAVEDTVALPRLYRPLMAADDDGVWIGNSIQGSPTSHAIYHVAPGAKTATGLVRSLTSGAKPRRAISVQWIAASGDHMWAGIGTNLTQESIWRFDGASGIVLYQVPSGFDPFGAVVGNFADGLWTEVPSYRPTSNGPHAVPNYEQILEINPATGGEHVVAKLPPLPALETDVGTHPDQMVWHDGSLYVLEPPFYADGYLGYSELVKVTPR